MRIYEVGGAVRDRLLGMEPKDIDYVVVGATPEEMEALGFEPVGNDFPVFLHPKTKEEYALARTERKSAKGYRGFAVASSPEVTLEEDLRRRDFTINAMARGEDGQIVDPWGGMADLREGVLRHVSEAFAEDPVRILRAGRFLARHPEFRLAEETLELMRGMVESGEAESLVAERVWKELSRGLMEAAPSRMLRAWRECGALAGALPELDAAWGEIGEEALRRLEAAAGAGVGLAERFASLLSALPEGSAQALARGVRASAECEGLAKTAARWAGRSLEAEELGAEGLLEIVEGCDGLRRPERFGEFLAARAAAGGGEEGRARLREALEAAAGIDGGAVAASAPKGGIPQAIREARLEAIRGMLARRESRPGGRRGPRG